MTRMIKISDVEHKTGLNRQTLYRWINQGRFPASGQYRGTNRNVWREDIIDKWIESTFEQEGAA